MILADDEAQRHEEGQEGRNYKTSCLLSQNFARQKTLMSPEAARALPGNEPLCGMHRSAPDTASPGAQGPNRALHMPWPEKTSPLELGFIHHDTCILDPTYSRKPGVGLVASYKQTTWVKGADPKGEDLRYTCVLRRSGGWTGMRGEVPEQYKENLLAIMVSLQESLYELSVTEKDGGSSKQN